MGQNAEELSTTPADIEATRADLSRNIDELSDKVSPQRVVERRKQAARDSLSSVRSKIMGVADSTRSSVGSAASGTSGSASDAAASVKGSAQSAVGSLESTTTGNPLVAGAMAFGAGMLIGALLPASEKERQASAKLVDAAKEHGQPLVDEAKSVGQEIGHDLSESASQAADKVKSQAQDSVETVKSEGESSVGQVKDQAPSSGWARPLSRTDPATAPPRWRDPSPATDFVPGADLLRLHLVRMGTEAPDSRVATAVLRRSACEQWSIEAPTGCASRRSLGRGSSTPTTPSCA
jgi:ElaB/YqjD/DUF883 family membrane-anchored ribosome-binding protein